MATAPTSPKPPIGPISAIGPTGSTAVGPWQTEPTGPTGTTGPTGVAAWWQPEVQQWLVRQRNAGATPADIASELVASGWDADVAATAAQRSLRQSDRHRALYGALCWSVGLGALGLATGLHQVLADTPAPTVAALAFTLAIVLLPLAGWCAWSAHELEASSPHAVWSPTRRMWFGTLAGLTAAIGLVRLITYVYLVVATMTGARVTPLSPNDQFQVLVSLVVVIPLFAWSLREWRRSDVVISGLRELDRLDAGSLR